ncbi:MAG: hypothetical protein AAB518_03410 [Patescibacteria group bacterium]
MEAEKKNCQNCKQDFVIESEDFQFYEKMKVPAPTWCPDCRQQRRYAWRNDRNLYRRNCDLCGKSIVTMYSASKQFKVYCPSCWWGDGWDSGSYGRDYDFKRPFFEQFQELQAVVPRIAMMGKNSVRSEYTNHSSDNKDCFMCSSAMRCENVMYSDFIFESRDSMDCMAVITKSERCYQCINVDNSYQCQYCILCNFCSNCFYCYDLRGCTDCFLSVNLRNKSNCFLNKQYSKEEYQAKIKEFKLGSHAAREKLYAQFVELLQGHAVYKYAVVEHSTNVTGSYIFDSKNTLHAFDVADCEDVKYVANVENAVKDTMDSYRCADHIELLYECSAQIRSYNSKFCNLTYDVSHLEYCDNCFNSQNLFGCIGLKKGEYMILNKKYSPEEFKAIKEKIISHMKSAGEYGEFFPITLSPFGYNESHNWLFKEKLTKEEVVTRGWKWEDNTPGTFGKETLLPEQIPDDIAQISDDMLKQVLKCETCSRNYNIVQPELEFYRREKIPIPRHCYACRDLARIALRAPRKLWHRSCVCRQSSHFHGNEKCLNEFETPYSSDRPEKIYCEQCYQAEVV